MTIVLVQCASTKASKPARAEDLYQGSYFEEAKRAARRVSDRWFILSAKHFLLSPTRIIAPYNQRLPAKGDAEWAAVVLDSIRQLDLIGSRFIVLAAENYCIGWADAVEAERPLRGVAGIGNRRKVMKGYS